MDDVISSIVLDNTYYSYTLRYSMFALLFLSLLFFFFYSFERSIAIENSSDILYGRYTAFIHGQIDPQTSLTKCTVRKETVEI